MIAKSHDEQIIKIVHPGVDHDWFANYSIKESKIAEHAQDLLIINCSSEHWGDNNEFILNIHRILDRTHHDFFVLSHAPTDHGLMRNLIYYPYWCRFSMHHFHTLEATRPRRKFLGSLHGNARPHRKAHYLSLLQKFPYEDMLVSAHKLTPGSPLRADEVVLYPEEVQQWNEIEKSLSSQSPILQDSMISIPALYDAYLHIITETTVLDRIFLTEKTWKPIAAGQLFAMFGNPGSMNFLASLGVDIFDDIIDHARYDNIPDWRIRMHQMHEVILDLKKQNIESLWNKTLQRRLTNQKRFFAGEFFGDYVYPDLDGKFQPHVVARR